MGNVTQRSFSTLRERHIPTDLATMEEYGKAVDVPIPSAASRGAWRRASGGALSSRQGVRRV